MKTLGRKIAAARRRKGWRGEDLGRAVGLSKSMISVIEKDGLKGGLDPDILIRIAEALEDFSLLVHHCRTCPILNHLFHRYFPELGATPPEPAAVAARLRRELALAAQTLKGLTERLRQADFMRDVDLWEYLAQGVPRVAELRQGIENLEFELVAALVRGRGRGGNGGRSGGNRA